MDMSASSQEAMAYEEAAEAGEMQLHTTFMFVITASCSLVLIFYFMSGAVSSPICAPSVHPAAVSAQGAMPNRKGSLRACVCRLVLEMGRCGVWQSPKPKMPNPKH